MDISMNITALSTALSTAGITNDIQVAVLDKSLDTMEELGAGMTKMMEASVMPHLGQNIDILI